MPKFSIIVPVYKVEKYIRKCVESLINQTLHDIEIILVDDGSPDNCGHICDEYAKSDTRIKVIHKLNGGVSAARNDGLETASGKWVIFCDSDDWLEQNACEKLYNKGEETGADVVIGDIYTVFNENKSYRKLFLNEFVIDSQKEKERLISSAYYPLCSTLVPRKSMTGYGGPWNKAVRRELLLKWNIRFDVGFKGDFDDRYYAINIYGHAEKIAYIQSAVYNYVSVLGSITKSYKADMLEINDYIFKKFSEFAYQYDQSGILKNAYYAMVIFRLATAMELYFFNENNPKSKSDRKANLKEIIYSDTYFTAANNVKTSKLKIYHKNIVFAVKHRCASLLYLLYLGKNNIKKVFR